MFDVSYVEIFDWNWIRRNVVRVCDLKLGGFFVGVGVILGKSVGGV